MNTDKTLFAQVTEFLPWKTFGWIVARHGGNSRVWTLSCGEQYRAMACAQLAYRESLRDIETCLSVQASKLYHMGFSEPVRRSTLADANEARDWRIYAELAERLIVQARKLYAGEDLGLELTNTVYALDSTTIDLCLSVFPWAHFRTTESAVKMHTLLDLRGNIPSFLHIRVNAKGAQSGDGKTEFGRVAARLKDRRPRHCTTRGKGDAASLRCWRYERPLQRPVATGHGLRDLSGP